MTGRPSVLLTPDIPGWAFDNMARGIISSLGKEFDFDCQFIDEQPTGDYDVCVNFWWSESHELRRVRARRRIALISDHHSWRDRGDLRRQLRHVDAIIAVNQRLADELAAFTALPIFICGDTVDTDLFALLPMPDRFAIGWTGNSAHRHGTLKGLPLIQEAAHRLGVPLVVQDRVTDGILSRPQMARWYERISCYVCASTSEGTPNPILEALACGRSIVSTDVGLVPDLLKQGAPIEVVPRTVDGIMSGILRARDAHPRPAAARKSVLKYARPNGYASWRSALIGPSAGLNGPLLPMSDYNPVASAVLWGSGGVGAASVLYWLLREAKRHGRHI